MNRKDRESLKELVYFMELLSLMVGLGYDLAYAWPLAIDASVQMPEPIRCRLRLRRTSRVSDHLSHLAKSWPLRSHRHWFALLFELNRSGTPMGVALSRLCGQLRQDYLRELERFGQAIPQRTNLIIMVFFLPAALVVLLGPLLLLLRVY